MSPNLTEEVICIQKNILKSFGNFNSSLLRLEFHIRVPFKGFNFKSQCSVFHFGELGNVNPIWCRCGHNEVRRWKAYVYKKRVKAHVNSRRVHALLLNYIKDFFSAVFIQKKIRFYTSITSHSNSNFEHARCNDPPELSPYLWIQCFWNCFNKPTLAL
jgi:hypothetical protein